MPAAEALSEKAAATPGVSVPDAIVSIKSPHDNILNPAKLSRHESGSAVTGFQAELGSSPELHHKDAKDREPLSSEKVEEVFSQFGSSISPEHSFLGSGLSHSGSENSFSDYGSSNAFKPDTPVEMSETTK